MTPRTATTALASVALAAALTVVLAGCGIELSDTPRELSQEERVTQQAELAARPSLETMVARYEEMQQRIRDRLDTEIGPFAWKVVRDGDQGGCGANFPGMGGLTRDLPPWGFDANIPDTDWPRAKQIVTEITAEYGFETPTLQIDRAGYHKTTGAGLELGAHYELGTQINTTMQVTTGCHLREADRTPT
jgi:hypothetical protein